MLSTISQKDLARLRDAQEPRHDRLSVDDLPLRTVLRVDLKSGECFLLEKVAEKSGDGQSCLMNVQHYRPPGYGSPHPSFYVGLTISPKLSVGATITIGESYQPDSPVKTIIRFPPENLPGKTS